MDMSLYSDEEKDQMKHKAYTDVLEVSDPTEPNNELYMFYYHSYRSIAGEKHFDKYYSEADYEPLS